MNNKIKIIANIIYELLKPNNVMDLICRLIGIYFIYSYFNDGFFQIRVEGLVLVLLGIALIICKWSVNNKWLKFLK